MHSKWKDVWMMCEDVPWIQILWISLEIDSHPTVPCHNWTLKSTRPPWWVGLPVGCSTPEFIAELSLAYKRCIAIGASKSQTQLLTLKHRVRLFKPIIFSLKMESLSVTEIPSTKIGRMESATHLYKGLLIQGWPTYQKASGSSDSRTSDTPWDKKYKVKLPPRSWER